VKAFDTCRAEQKRMQQRNIKEKHDLEENGVEIGRQHLKMCNNSMGEHEMDISGSA